MRILPRPFGQVLNDALRSLARTWKPLTLVSLAVFLPAAALSLLVFEVSGATEFLEVIFSDPGYLETVEPDALADLARPFLVAGAIALMIQAVATLFVYLVCHMLTASDIKGTALGGRDATRRALNRFGRALLAGSVAAVVVLTLVAVGLFVWSLPAVIVGTPNATSAVVAVVLFLGLVGPGIWLAISLTMFTPVLALESRGSISSLRRSRELVRGRWWPTAGFLVMVGLLGSVATQLIQLVAIPLAAVGGVGAGLLLISLAGLAAQGPIVGAMGAAYTHWYVDLRSRLEPLMRDQL